ncbi:MAG: Ribonuclease BN [bacterium ADurb.Bin478]|nr:MAG: Ribonuclease BN [bacterium ADurb.Bin478]
MDHIRLLFLGTGAALPSPRRMLPALALILDGQVALFDCSEGTQMRMQQAGLSPARIRHIFISHLHGDHLFGLPGLITSQHLLKRSEPLHVYGPAELELFLRTVYQVTQHHVSFPVILVPCPPQADQTWTLEGFSVQSLPLDHGPSCFGYRFIEHDRPGKFDADRAQALGLPNNDLRTALIHGETVEWDGRRIRPEEVVGPAQKGRTIAYCTDTRPCENVRILARNADVLIHESTFHPDQEALAEETGHSTSRQAAESAAAAGCRQLYLYHISGRQDDRSEVEMLEAARSIFPATEMPLDYGCYPVPVREPL